MSRNGIPTFCDARMNVTSGLRRTYRRPLRSAGEAFHSAFEASASSLAESTGALGESGDIRGSFVDIPRDWSARQVFAVLRHMEVAEAGYDAARFAINYPPCSLLLSQLRQGDGPVKSTQRALRVLSRQPMV